MGLEDCANEREKNPEEILKKIRARLHSDINYQDTLTQYLYELNETLTRAEPNLQTKEYNEFKDSLNHIKKALENLNESKHKLQELIHEGENTYLKKTIHAYPLIEDFYKTIKLLKSGTSINLKKSYECLRGKRVITNKDALMQIMNNFAENAYEHSNAKNITIGAEENTDTFTLYVKDDGVGIPKDKQDKIFNGERIDSKQSELSTGLPYNLELAEKINTKIELTSKENKGSTFSLYLQKSK